MKMPVFMVNTHCNFDYSLRKGLTGFFSQPGAGKRSGICRRNPFVECGAAAIFCDVRFRSKIITGVVVKLFVNEECSLICLLPCGGESFGVVCFDGKACRLRTLWVCKARVGISLQDKPTGEIWSQHALWEHTGTRVTWWLSCYFHAVWLLQDAYLTPFRFIPT